MSQKKIPMRTCVISKEKAFKKDLIRIVKTPNGVIVDLSGKVNGRGVYLKKDLNVIEKALKSRILEKNLECKIEDSIYEELKKII